MGIQYSLQCMWLAHQQLNHMYIEYELEPYEVIEPNTGTRYSVGFRSCVRGEDPVHVLTMPTFSCQWSRSALNYSDELWASTYSNFVMVWFSKVGSQYYSQLTATVNDVSAFASQLCSQKSSVASSFQMPASWNMGCRRDKGIEPYVEI